MAENQTRATDGDVEAFLARVADPVQRADAAALSALMHRATGAPPVMWGPGIVGFGSRHYRTDAGREGDILQVGFAPRKGKLVLYGLGSQFARDDVLARLGRHATGKGCLYVKRLADVDADVLGEMIAAVVAATPA